MASSPLVSLLSFLWLYYETKDLEKVISLSKSIFWLVLPSLVLFIALPRFLAAKVDFALSLFLSVLLMLLSYLIMTTVLKRFGIEL